MKCSVKWLSIFLTIVVTMAFTPITAIAESEPIVYEYIEGWGCWYYIIENGGATLVDYGGDGESFYLPDKLGGYPLKVIGESSCDYLDWLTVVDIPDSVVEIGYYAFGVCTFLETVNMGDNVEIIDDYAFMACENLKEVNFGTGVKEIGAHAFDFCISLEEIVIPDGVEVLSDRTFDRCFNLQSVYLPDSLYFIGNDAFSNCESLREITIPEGVTYIGEYAFNGCSALEQIALPATVGYIQEAAFRFCDNLTDVYYSGTQEARDFINIKIENDPLYDATWHYGWIGPMPPLEEKPGGSETNPDHFYRTYVDGGVVITGYWGSDTDIVIPSEIYGDPVIGIGDFAFSWSELTSVVIPEGVIYIDEYAFSGCESLVSVSLPSTMETIGSAAFNNCTALNDVLYNGTEDQAALIEIGDNNDWLLNATWQYVTGEEEPDEPDEPELPNIPEAAEGDFIYSVVNGEAVIIDYAGEGGDVAIPDTLGGYPVITIGEDAFNIEDAITSVVIPDSVVTIEANAFSVLDKMTSVVIGNGVKTIGANAFGWTESLTSVTFGNNVVSIGERAFERSGITSITMPDTVTEIGAQAFYMCHELTSVRISSGVRVIPEKAFWDCTALKSIEIPNTVTEIAFGAFMDTGLTSIHIPASVTSIGVRALRSYSMQAVTVDVANPVYKDVDGVLFSKDGKTLVRYPTGRSGSYAVPDGVVVIGEEAFERSKNLSAVTLSDSVTTLNACAFNMCYALPSVDLNNVVTVGEKAFYQSNKFTSIIMGKSVETIGAHAFSSAGLASVWYRGSESDAAAIEVADFNDQLARAHWYYDCTELKVQYEEEVEHSVMDTENGTGLAFKFDLSVSVGVKNGNMVDYTATTIDYMGHTCNVVSMGSVLTNQAGVDPVLENVNGITVIDVPVVYLTGWNEDSCSFAIRIIDIPENQMERILYARPYYIIEADGEQIVVYGEVNAAACAEYME